MTVSSGGQPGNPQATSETRMAASLGSRKRARVQILIRSAAAACCGRSFLEDLIVLRAMTVSLSARPFLIYLENGCTRGRLRLTLADMPARVGIIRRFPQVTQ